MTPPYTCVVILIILSLSTLCQAGNLFDLEKLGLIPDEDSMPTVMYNTKLFNDTLNSLEAGDSMFISNKTFHLIGGISASFLKRNTIYLDGTLSFIADRDAWPKNEQGGVQECIMLHGVEDFVITTTSPSLRYGTINGNGKVWWGALQFLIHQEDRPRLIHMTDSKNVIIERLFLLNSPYWSFWCENVDGLVIRYSKVEARWTNLPGHSKIDLQAFNTDGFDVTGRNVHIHDCDIYNQDDCVSIKDGAQDMLIERVTCSGLGLVIGSIGSSQVKNITFRNCDMYKTVKGIYMKTRYEDGREPIGDEASISDITYENIVITEPQQFAIWIGPAQQTGNPCSLLWPYAKSCIMSPYQTWSNILLKNITVIDPEGSPGMIMGNSTNPITNLVFEDVVVMGKIGKKPFGPDYYCEPGGVKAIARGKTFPIPSCFVDSEKF